jgi:thiamine biosynthesis lipoprotein
MQIPTEQGKNILTAYKRSMRLMGNQFAITVVAHDRVWANLCIDQAVAEIQRIEQLLSTFIADSQTNLINDHAGIAPVQVDKEVYDLIARSVRISDLTQGAFDITYGSVDKRFWNFDATMTTLPDKKTAEKAIALINYRNVVLDPVDHSVFLKKKGMRIGFGGIAKGYAAESTKRVLLGMGVVSGVVNASGDLTAWGTQPDGSPWTIGIAHPDYRQTPFSWLNISNLAIATSGNYEKFVVIDGKRYSHTIDPKTGFPVCGIKSVSVICPNAEIADALATPITIMGIKPALHMVNQMKGIACIIVDERNKIYTSDNINLAP